MMSADCNGRRRCRPPPPPRARLLASKGKRGLHFRIQRKILRPWQIDRRAGEVEPVGSLLGPPQRFRNVMCVAQEKIRRIHQRAILFFRGCRESPQCRLGKRIAHGASLVRVLAPGAVDRKSTRLNSSHGYISYAVFCLKKKTTPALELLPPHRRHS